MTKNLKAALIMVLILAAPALALGSEAEDRRAHRFMQGVVSGYAGSGMVLNEQQAVTLSTETMFFSSDGTPASYSSPAVGSWVYVEGALDGEGVIEAEKLYFLPGYVAKKDRRKYPFMQLP